MQRRVDSAAPVFWHSLLDGLLAGAGAGLVCALLTVPLRRLAGVSDRSMVNGISTSFGSIALWAVIGIVYGLLAGRTSRAALWALLVAVVIAVIPVLSIYADVGPLSPYPIRCASLAVPIIAMILALGSVLFFGLLRTELPLLFATPSGIAAAAIVGVVVAFGDKQPSVHFTLGKLPRTAATTAAAPAAPAASSGATQSGGTPTSAATAAAGGAPSQAAATPTPAVASTLHFTVGQGSEVAYTVNEQLARLPSPSDAIGKTQKITGDLFLTQAGLAPQPASTFTVDLSTLTSDAGARDNFIKRNTLQTDQFPNAVYTITGVDGFPAGYHDGDQVKLTLHGMMTIHGVTAPLDWAGTAQFSGGTLEAVMSTDFKMELFGLQPPQVSVAKSTDGVHLDLHLVANQQS